MGIMWSVLHSLTSEGEGVCGCKLCRDGDTEGSGGTQSQSTTSYTHRLRNPRRHSSQVVVEVSCEVTAVSLSIVTQVKAKTPSPMSTSCETVSVSKSISLCRLRGSLCSRVLAHRKRWSDARLQPAEVKPRAVCPDPA